MLDNTSANLARWLADPQTVKPGTLMPQVSLSGIERGQLVRWLEGLR